MLPRYGAATLVLVLHLAFVATVGAEPPTAVEVARACRRGGAVRCSPATSLSLEGGVSLVRDPDGPLGEPTGAPDSIRVDDLSYAPAAAARVTLERRLSPCDRVFVRGTWWGETEDELLVRGEFGVRPPNAVVPTSDVTLRAEASAWSAEVGWARSLLRRGRLEAELRLGLGTLGFEETLDAVVGNLATVRGEASTLYLLARPGVAAQVRLSERLTATLAGTALLGLSDRRMEVADSGLLTPGPKENVERATSFAYGGEAELRLTWHVRPRLAVFASYDVLLVGEVLRARDGLDFTRADIGAVQPRHRLDELFLQTVTLGVTISF
jgi:hypothetical protein